MNNRFLTKHAPTIFSVCAGISATALGVLSGRAVYKYMTSEKPKETLKDKVKVAVPIFAPAAVAYAATLMCIFESDHMNKQEKLRLNRTE